MAIFYDVVGPAAIGTGTARTAIDATYRVPSAAKELVGLYASATHEAVATAESLVCIGDIIGTDFRHQPCEFPFPIASGKLGAVDQAETTPMTFLPIHAPLNGTEILNIGVEPCSAIAGDGQAALTMVFSTARTGKPTIYGKASREVATGTTAGTITTGTSLTLSNARTMYEVWAAAVTGTATVAADEEFSSHATMSCTQWDPIQTLNFLLEPIHGIEATAGCSKVKQIMKLPCDLRFKDSQATIDTTLTQYDAWAAAGVYVHGIRYLGSR